MQRKLLGQFYTTNACYILQGLEFPEGATTVVEPFCGQGDLLNTVHGVEFELYDIDPKYPGTVQRDTLLDPPDYRSKYVLTNPPFLARNKHDHKAVFEKYNTNDLFKCFLYSLVEGGVEGGVVIVPLNFWSSMRRGDIELRRMFLSRYRIGRVNVFEFPVFDDTSYSVCAFQFIKGDGLHQTIPFYVFKTKGEEPVLYEFLLDNPKILPGGELYELETDCRYTVKRWVRGESVVPTNILVHCIDGGVQKILMEMVEDEKRYMDDTPNLSARTFATLVVSPTISLEVQKELVKQFNVFFQEKRKEFNSLFLANYREGSRKRIPFELLYRIVGWLLTNIDKTRTNPQ